MHAYYALDTKHFTGVLFFPPFLGQVREDSALLIYRCI